MKEKIKKKLKEAVSIIKRTIEVYTKHDMDVYSGYTTFYFMMSIVPLLMMLISIVNLLPWFSVEQVSTLLSRLIPDIPQIRHILLSVILNLNRQSGQMISYIFALTSLWSGSHGVSAMMSGLEKINHTPRESFTKKFRAIFYTVMFTLLIPSMLLFQGLRASLHSAITSLFSFLNILEAGKYINQVLKLSGILTLAAMIPVILLTFTHLPSGKRDFKAQLPGAIFTSVFWVLFTKAFGFFIRRFWKLSSVYGALAAVFLAAMWLKFVINILFLGASLNRALQVRISKDCST